MSPELVGALVGGIIAIAGVLIGTLLSHKLQNIREKQRNESRRQSAARTIASEIHGHKEAVEALLNRKDITIKETRDKLDNVQWRQQQKDIWKLDPSLGVLFRQYYDELENMKSRQFTFDSYLEKEFAPLIEKAEECLKGANFPYSKLKASDSLTINTSEEERAKDKK